MATNPANKPTQQAVDQIRSDSIKAVMESNFLRYSMSVIVSRALPDVRDGLKPVHRRILYVMHRNGLKSGGKTVKSARIIGDVLGKYHPHGDTAVYEAMARLVADWSTRYPLVIGQGNFGNIDGDPPAAPRYTEAKLSRTAEVLLEDLDKETVAWRPNYDDTESEPTVLPAKLPNLLINGQIGIAVGMATSIPPHNLAEVVAASLQLIDKPQSTVDDILTHIKGPDFPTGGIIYGAQSLRQAYATGKGGIIVRARARIEAQSARRQQIIIDQVPYGINLASMIEKMADLVRSKKITTIADIRNESSRGKIRIVVDLKTGAYPKKVLNQLYQQTTLQTAFHFNMLALVGGIQPQVLNIIDILKHHLAHRQSVVRRRTEYELKQAQARAHILAGLAIALANIDQVVAIIRGSQTAAEAQQQLQVQFKLTETQTKAILAMPLRSLVGLERQKIETELKQLHQLITKLEALLADENKIVAVVRQEFVDLADKFVDDRRTRIVTRELGRFSDEDLIPNQQVVVTLTTIGYIKRSPASNYKVQGRGGKGRKGMNTRDQDLIQQLLVANTHDWLLFFTNQGRVFRLKCYEVPEANLNAKGVAVVNLLQTRGDETITAAIKMPQKTPQDQYLFMCTKKGVVKKSALDLYRNLRQNGLITIRLDSNDELKWVRLSSGQDEIVISTANGQSNRFSETDVRATGRATRGVRGIRIKDGDWVVGMDLVRPGAKLLIVSQNGFGKKTKIDNFPPHKRGGIGVKAAAVNKKTGQLITVRSIDDNCYECIAITAKGKVIRTKLDQVPTLSRITQGVTIMKTDQADQVVSLTVMERIVDNQQPT